jgi:hypothetical protein
VSSAKSGYTLSRCASEYSSPRALLEGGGDRDRDRDRLSGKGEREAGGDA